MNKSQTVTAQRIDVDVDVDVTREVNLDTQSSDNSAEEMSESGRAFQSLNNRQIILIFSTETDDIHDMIFHKFDFS